MYIYIQSVTSPLKSNLSKIRSKITILKLNTILAKGQIAI